MKDFNEFLNENKNLEWEDIFGKKHSHIDTLKKDIVDGLVHIIMDENKISEKAFEKIDDVISDVKSKINDEIISEAEIHLQSGKRMSLFYEQLYDKLF